MLSDNMSSIGVSYQVSGIRCQVITCQVSVSGIKCRGSGVKYNMSSTCVRYQVPASGVKYNMSSVGVRFQVSGIRCQV